MADTDFILRFVYPRSPSTSDLRTFRVYEVVAGSSAEVELYRFHHPMTGLTTSVTTIHRKNLATLVFEPAGSIEWSSDTNATVHFGLEEVPVRQLRKAKKSSSRSRRFKAGNSEYKWKIAENEADLFCVDSKGKTIASWSQQEDMLRVALRCEPILDRLVVSCMMNLWFKWICSKGGRAD